MTGATRASEAAATGGAGARPTFSIVSAVYNVGPYLPEFIASIEAQKIGRDRFEVIMVDDGSTDDSLEQLQAWRDASAIPITVIRQPNAGQGAARNAGLAVARGEWVTFTDPDDVVLENFLAAAATFAVAHPEIAAMTPRVKLYDEARGKVANRHPRRWQFSRGDRVVDLYREPNVFTGSSTTSFFRLDRIRALGLRYDDRVRPAFEDGHFAAVYLLEASRPLIGVLRSAVYLYRKREATTSTMHTAWEHPGRYSAMFEYGYLDLVARSRRAHGRVVEWIQQLLVYELSYYLAQNDAPSSRIAVPPELEESFRAHVAELVRAIDPDVIGRHRVRRLRPIWVDVLQHAYRDERWHSPVITRTRRDRQMGLQRLIYRYIGEPPVEVVEVDGQPGAVPWSKRASFTYFGDVRLHERIVWVPDDPSLRVTLDGAAMRIVNDRSRSTGPARPAVTLGDVLRLATRSGRRAWRRRQPDWLIDTRARIHARTIGRYRYRDAWVLMDRIHDADDNGERLFEHLRARHRDINAWFVLQPDTPDWQRLSKGRTGRLVAHGSVAWRSLMLNARWLLSSHSDAPITRPPEIVRLRPRPTWKLGFLQHGVIKDDLSPWLNLHDHDLFVVSTAPEYESIVADGSGYTVTPKEVRLTGLPRFDRLLRVGASVRPADRDLVIVAPTWRSWLALPLERGVQRRDMRSELWSSEYLERWLDVLGSPEIARAVRGRGWTLGFMPHPNLQDALAGATLPPHVELLTFAGNDVQRLYARLALLVTDYSSVAFNAAYLDRPVVYYQFDRERVLAGGHVGRHGYFEYERDGFGPVAVDHATAVQHILDSVAGGPSMPEPYASRVDATFPQRDGNASERVVRAVLELSTPWRPGTA